MSSKRAMKQAQKQAYAKHRNITNSRFGLKKKSLKNKKKLTFFFKFFYFFAGGEILDNPLHHLKQFS